MRAADQRFARGCSVPVSRRAWGVRLAALCAVVGLIAAPCAQAAGGATPRNGPNLRPLWKTYPLNPRAGQTPKPVAPAVSRVRSPQNRTATLDTSGGGGTSPLVPLAALAALLLLGTAAVLVFRRRPEPVPTKGAQMPRFLSRRSKSDSAPTAPGRTDDLAVLVASYAGAKAAETDPADPAEQREASGAETYATAEAMPAHDEPSPEEEPATTEEETPVAAETTASPEAGAGSGDGGTARDTAHVAAHVASVLQAAEEAAARLVDDARQKAENLPREAERDAAALIEAAEARAARVEAEAEQVRCEAEAAATETRASAERDAATIRAEAERDAANIRAAAERDASSIQAAAERRRDALLRDAAIAEERLRGLMGAMRDLTSQVDTILDEGGEAEAAADHPATRAAFAENGASLTGSGSSVSAR